MRFRSVLVGITMLTATPALASTIVQNLTAVQPVGDSTPYDIDGALFNPALGMLTAVTGELMGTYTPYVTLSGGPAPPPSPGVVSTTFFLSGDTRTFPTQTITPVSPGTYIGTPTSIDILLDFGTLIGFISSAPGPVTLADFGFNSNVENRGSFSPSDDTSFVGTFTLTYTFQASTTVPEPASLLILGLGAGIITLLKRCRAT